MATKSKQGSVWLVATLDTKQDEALFLAAALRSRGVEVSVIDIGIRTPSPPGVTVDNRTIAAAGDSELLTLGSRGDRASALGAMATGLSRMLRSNYDMGTVQGVIAIGGSGGASVAAAAMRSLPVGIPKLLISTVASGDTRPYIEGKDITMMFPVVDLIGLNRVLRTVLTQAAAAFAGMVSVSNSTQFQETTPRIAITSFGATTPCVNECLRLLESLGHEVYVFHARGTGGTAMEEFIVAGEFAGVLDLTLTELADELVGGTLSAGPDRLKAATRTGVPQVIVPGALDMVNFGPAESVPQHFRGRKLQQHGPHSTLMRTIESEMTLLGHLVGKTLTEAVGPYRVLIPNKGFSSYDQPGGPFFEPAADAAFGVALESHLKDLGALIYTDYHINDPSFARVAVQQLLSLMKSNTTVSPWRGTDQQL